jgi:hypothetical protein
VAAWAEARSTQDVDLVINLPEEQMTRFSDELARREVLIPPDLMLEQFLETRGDVPLVGYHLKWSHKAEMFLLRPGDALRESALMRRRRIELGPPLGQLAVLAPEDLILYKLAYFSLSQQQKHVRDITAILLAQKANLNQDYLNRWVEQLGLDAVWHYMQSQTRGVE